MPKGSKKLTESRKKEIVDACEKLYQTRGFHDITIKDIGQAVSMSRPSIYNYYETREEIFLALLKREYEKWTADIREVSAKNEKLTPDELAHSLAQTLEPRKFLLKISAMNLYEIEDNSREENLVEFKTAFLDSLEAVKECLRKFLPDLSDERIEEIRYAFFPFMYGIYPYVYPTEKQMKAMDTVGISYQKTTIMDMTYHFLRQLLE